jgi:hypothetical protein
MSESIHSGIEMRRSQRVALRVPIQVRWTPPGEPVIAEETTTLVVNAHGALIVLAMKAKAGARIFVKNRALVKEQDRECRIVRVSERIEGKHEAAIEFLRPDARFWGLEFPPDDWR